MRRQIFKATAIAGALDITAACIQAYLVKGTAPDIVLKYIASGLFGKDAFTGGFGYVLAGLLIHFFITFACTVTYFSVYPKIKLLHYNILLSALFVALIAWTITTRIIIPLSRIQPAPFDFTKAGIAIAILFFCIGLPITLFAKDFYSGKGAGD
jgi:hypothetical protein